MASNFQYETLANATDEIRLLTLLPGSLSDPVSCHLSIAQLHGNIDYEALSYVWAPKEPRQTILVNGKPFEVTWNLFTALRRLRWDKSARILWADAVCINQSDDTERAQQVTLMRRIYTMTSCSLIWLGEEPERPELVVSAESTAQIQQLLDVTDGFLESTLGLLKSSDQLLRDTAELLHPNKMLVPNSAYAELESVLSPTHDYRSFTVPQDTFAINNTVAVDWTDASVYQSGNEALRHQVTIADDSIFHAFCLFRDLAENKCLHTIECLQLGSDITHTQFANVRRAARWLIERPWFDRMWTVQECVLPKKVVVIYGPVTAPFDMFMTAGSNFLRHRSSCCASLPGVRDMLNFVVDKTTELQSVQQAQRLTGTTDLCTLLRTFRSRDATDNRDKVYALLPLANELQQSKHRIEVSYGEDSTPYTVFIDATIACLNNSKSLDVLSQPSHVQRNLDLPSWVADYASRAASAGTAGWYNHQLPLYNANGYVDGCVDVVDRRVLVLRGVFVDNMELVAKGMFHGAEDGNLDVLREWYCDAEEFYNGNSTAKNWFHDFWRTVCGDCIVTTDGPKAMVAATQDEVRRVVEDDICYWNAYCRANAIDTSLRSEISSPTAFREDDWDVGAIAHTIKVTTAGRKFFITKNGHMGVGPFYSGLQYPRREKLFVCAGGKAPLVFKEVGEMTIPSIGKRITHELVGDCYLHGFMDGEGMRDFEAKKQEIFVV